MKKISKIKEESLLFACNSNDENLIVKGTLYPYFYLNSDNDTEKIDFFFKKNCNIPNSNSNLVVVNIYIYRPPPSFFTFIYNKKTIVD
jgi:hypothetical protein